MTQSLTFDALVPLAITEGATTPNPGQSGVIVYSTTLNKPMFWNGTSWSSNLTSITATPALLSNSNTTLFASTANSAAVQDALTLSIPANTLVNGSTFEWALRGTQSQSAAATNVVVGINSNGTSIAAGTLAGGTTAQTNRAIHAYGSVTYVNGTWLGNAYLQIAGLTTAPSLVTNITGVAAPAANNNNLRIHVQTSTANAANIIRAASMYIKQVR